MKLVKRKNLSNSRSLRYKQENNGTWKVNAIPKNKDKTIKTPNYTKIHYKSLTKALVQRWVFNAVLKADKVLQFLMWVGRWFHSLGEQIANEWSLKELLDLGSWRRWRFAEWSPSSAAWYASYLFRFAI